MPWQERTRMDERVRFITTYLSGTYSMTELCARYGISRVSGYKWLRRYRAEGFSGLVDRSRSPQHCPHKTPAAVVQRLLELRRRHPDWGPQTLVKVLKAQQPAAPWPAASTAAQYLQRAGLIKPRRQRHHRRRNNAPTLAAPHPNALWTVDFKGQFRTGAGAYCYPLTVMDRASRYLLACDGKTNTATGPVQQSFRRLFQHYGLPQRILSDNGTPFAATGLAGLSRLAVWWLKLGIEPLRITPGHPEQNGVHERMHRSLKAATARPPAANHRAQQRAFDRFRHDYNIVRPHQALDDATPHSCYQPSARPYPGQPPPIDYPGHYERRTVSAAGAIKWRNQSLFISSVLSGEVIGLAEIDDGIWSVYFVNKLLGRLHERTRTIYD